MRKKRVLLLGGNRSNVPAIRAARRAGFFIFVADPHSEAPGLAEADVPLLIDVRDCNSIVDAVREKGGVDGIVSMSEVGIVPAASMSTHLGLASISQKAAANARSKAAMRRLWASTGFSVVFAEVGTLKDASQAAESLGFPLVFKPDQSFGGSRGVRLVECHEQVEEAFTFAIQSGLPGTSIVIERRILGTEYSCEVLIYEGEISVLCIGQKVKSPPPYRVDVSVQYPAQLSRLEEDTVSEMCRTALRTLGVMRGAAHVEFAYTSKGPVLFELGARCGGGHTPAIAHMASGVEEFIEVCRMACGSAPSQFHPTRRWGGEYRFLIFPPGRVRMVEIAEEVRRHPGIIDVELTVKDGDGILPIHTTSNRPGFLVTWGRDRTEAVELANWASRQITVSYDDGSICTALPLSAFEEVRYERSNADMRRPIVSAH
jgi:biotin carboxylase